MSKDRLADLLNMLASDNDGERANAARMIAAMAKKEGKLVSDFVRSGGVIYRDRVVERTVYRDRPVDDLKRAWTRPDPDDLRGEDFRRPWGNPFRDAPRSKQKRKPFGDTTILDGLRWASDFPEHLNAFEMDFVSDILMKHSNDYELSPAQERTAEKIILKVKGCEGESLV